MPARRATRFHQCACLIFWVLTASLVGLLNPIGPSTLAVAQEPEPAEKQDFADGRTVEQLIDDLASPSYRKREGAGRALVQQGPKAMKDLADQLIDAPPETQWRIKKVLGEIASRYDNETLFKAMALLKLRFNDIDATSLKREWQNSRRNQAIAKLRSLGMKIVDDFNAANLNGWGNNRIQIVPGQIFARGEGIQPFPIVPLFFKMFIA